MIVRLFTQDRRIRVTLNLFQGLFTLGSGCRNKFTLNRVQETNSYVLGK